MERFGVISDEKLTEEIWADGGHYYLRQEWNNGWLSETGVNYNWVNPNEDKLDDKVFLTNVEELEIARAEALARIPKTIQFESHIGLDFDHPEILLKVPKNVDLDEFCMHDVKVTFEIIEEVQE